jgi:hypothetical protein
MVEKDNYATTSPLNEGAGATNTYMSDSPLGNVRIYDLDAVVPPIERMQIVPTFPNLANQYTRTLPKNVAISESQELTLPTTLATSTITPIAPKNKPNYWLYGGAYVVVALVAYKLYKK